MPLMLSQALMWVSLLACHAQEPAEPPTRAAEAEDAASAASTTGGYALQGDLEVTAVEFGRSIAWREWVTGQPIGDAFGPEWIDDDALLRRLTSSLLDEALLLHDAARWELTVSEQERETALREIPAVATLLGATDDVQSSTLTDAGLTWEDFERAADLAVLIDRWNEHRIDTLSEEDLRNAYLARNNRLRLEIALVPNVHPQETIRGLVATRADDIERYYADHSNFFLLPRGARLREVAVTGGAEDESARQRAEELRQRAADEGISALVGDAAVAQPITRGNTDAWIPQAQLPAAFDLLPGELSEVVRFSEYWVFFELLEHRGRELRPLDDDVRAQIAHHFAREGGPAAAPMAHAVDIANALRTSPENAVEIYRENRVLSETTSDFRRTSGGVVPTVGEAPALSDLVFANGVEVGDVIGPVHVPAGIAIARVLVRERVTDEDFQRDRESFVVEFSGYMRESAWPARVAEYSAGHTRDVDLAALRVALIAE